ncbi:MAG TPA: neutral zinc metallopeptidase [Candidatus Limnocylindria bacterium]|nr:neutral zinc metallopeptidase [Candidatus Limnocylindria bacterium]
MGEVTGGADPTSGSLEALWQEILADAAVDVAYEPPARVVGYRGGELPDTPCSRMAGVDFWRQNAFYCEQDRAIVYDEAWLRDFEGRFGPFAPAAILAHEWGHHVQRSFGGHTYSIQFELQADCFAGLFLASTEEREPGVYVVGDDLQAALATFFEIGNEAYDGEWFGAAEHGSPPQRMMAMGTGYLPISSTSEENPLPASSGLPWCHGYSEFMANDTATIGQYRFLNLPGRTETWLGSAYGIAADSRSGFKTSDIAMSWIETLPIVGEGGTQAQLEELWRIGFPGLVPLYDVPLPTPAYGSMAGRYVENRVQQTDGSEMVQSGVFALISPSDAVGGLIVVIMRDQPAPTELNEDSLAIIQEQLAAFYQVFNRLCGPDESGNAGDANLNVACMSVQ